MTRGRPLCLRESLDRCLLEPRELLERKQQFFAIEEQPEALTTAGMLNLHEMGNDHYHDFASTLRRVQLLEQSTYFTVIRLQIEFNNLNSTTESWHLMPSPGSGKSLRIPAGHS